MGILGRAGAEAWQAKEIAAAMAPIFSVKSLRTGHQIRFTLGTGAER